MNLFPLVQSVDLFYRLIDWIGFYAVSATFHSFNEAIDFMLWPFCIEWISQKWAVGCEVQVLLPYQICSECRGEAPCHKSTEAEHGGLHLQAM